MATKLAATYEQLTRAEFEEWCDSLGFGSGHRALKPSSKGVYHLFLSDTVAIEINSTTGSQAQVMGAGQASMSLRLVSRVTGQVLNKKAMGQSHFARTLNWRKNWAEGVKRMKDAYIKSKNFYDEIASIEDRDKYAADLIAQIEAVSGWESDHVLKEFHGKVEQGGILTGPQKALIQRAHDKALSQAKPHEVPEQEDPRLEKLRKLWQAAYRAGDSWTANFTRSVAEQIKAGRPLSDRQDDQVVSKLRAYKVI